MFKQPERTMLWTALAVSPFSGETGAAIHAVINTGKAYACHRLT